MFIIFGIIEFSIAHWATGMTEDAIRRSGRQAAQMGRSTDFGDRIGETAAKELRGLPSTATPQWMLVYKANEHGYPGLDATNWDTGMAQCMALDTCIKADWDPQAKTWSAFDDDAVWNSTTHNVCRTHGEVDRIGVAISIHYQPIIGMYDSFLRRTDGNGLVRWSVLAFEPVPTVLCE